MKEVFLLWLLLPISQKITVLFKVLFRWFFGKAGW
jgi:hypothetical protein